MNGVDFYLIFKISGISAFIFFGAISCYKQKIPLAASVSITVLSAIAAYFGSTYWYIFQNEDWKAVHSASEWASLMDGAGSVLYGWILGGSAAAYGLSKFFRLNPVKVFDILLPWLLAAQILNRFGCFSGQCCYGSPSSVSWAVFNDFAQCKVHPVQLYEAFVDAILLGVLFLQSEEIVGRRTFLYFMGYPFARFFLEFFRGDNKPVLLGMTVPQLTSVLILACVSFFVLKKRGNFYRPSIKN